ncbi:hypothetical protein Hanom_Chr03g00206041 [Helianthus anomalus]
MDEVVKDDVPMLSATNWPSDRHDYKPNQKFSNTNRSVSISIPVPSVEMSYGSTNRIDLTSPVQTEKTMLEVPVEQENIKHNKRQGGGNYHGTKSEHLLRSGQLGMCNDPFCTACPSTYYYKGCIISRIPKGVDCHGYKGWVEWARAYGGAKGCVREKLSLIKHFTSGVMNPHAKVVQQWNQFVVITCLFAIFLDPLFFYVL